MPKQNHIIRTFTGGLVLDIASEDLPDGFLVNNTRNVHHNRSGHLIGFRNHSAFLTSLDVNNPVYGGKHNEKDSQRLFHIEKFASQVSAIKSYAQDGYGIHTIGFPSGVELDPGKISVAQRLNHLLLGVGNTAAHTPLWYGKHNHTQFGVAPPANPEVLSAKLVSPTQLSSSNNFPRANDVVETDSRYYMISDDSPYVYKFNGDILEKRSSGSFGKLGAICTDQEAGHVWVWDLLTKTLYRLNSDLEVVSTINVTGLPNDGKIVTDIKVSSGWIYMLRKFSTNIYSEPTAWLYRLARNTGTANIQAEDISITSIDTYGGGNSVLNPMELALDFVIVDWQILRERFRPVTKGLIVNSGIVYALFHVERDYDFFYDTYPDQYAMQWTERVDNYRHFYLQGQTAPSSYDNAGNLVVARLGSRSGPGYIAKENIQLAVKNRTELNDVWQARHTSTNLSLYYVGSGSVWRMNRDWGVYAGNIHIEFNKQELSGFGSVQPTFSDSPVRWFSRNNPPTTGTIASNAATGQVQSLATLEITPIPGGFSIEDTFYYYAMSLIYDGYMESPLSDPAQATGPEESGFSVDFKVPQANINRRVTGMNIYRAEGTVTGRTEFFRLVDTLDFKLPPQTATVSGEDVYVFNYTDRKKIFELGPTFASNSGIFETMKEILPHYGLSVAHEDMLFIADCWHPEIDQAPLLLFRSQPFSFCSFNVETDLVRLEGPPTAMASFNGRIHVCDEQRMYVVDPVNMVIDTKVEGMNALNAYCMIATEYGLICAGTDQIRLFDGQSVRNVSDRIRMHPGANLSAFSLTPAADTNNSLRDYQYFTENATNIHCNYNQVDKTFTILGTIAGATIGYQLNMEQLMWNRLIKPAYVVVHSQCLNNGETLAYKADHIDKLFNTHLSEDHMDYVAEMSPFEADDENIEKWFYEVRVDYLGEVADLNVQVKTDSNVYSGNLDQPEKGTYIIPSGIYRKGKILYLRLTGKAKVKSVSVLFRPKQVRS